MEREYKLGRRSDGTITLTERLERIELRQEEHSQSMRKLEGRINILFGGLAVLVSIINIVDPIIETFIKAKP